MIYEVVGEEFWRKSFYVGFSQSLVLCFVFAVMFRAPSFLSSLFFSWRVAALEILVLLLLTGD